MCLFKSEVIKPNEDLVCYKVVRVEDNGELVGPYRLTPYKLNARMTAVFEHNFEYIEETFNGHSVQTNYKLGCGLMVEGGVFHSFVNKEDAIEFVRRYGNPEVKNQVHECIIPKDSDVIFLGEFQNRPSYGSSEIIVTDKKLIVMDKIIDFQ